MTLTKNIWLWLMPALRLWVCLAVTAFAPLAAFGYCGLNQPTPAYDSGPEFTVGYDVVSALATSEEQNGATGYSVLFAEFGELVAAKGGEFVLTGLGKAEARALAQGMGLPNAQAAAVNSAISRATSTSTLKVTQYGPDVIVQTFRPGRNGYQVIESVVTPNGTKTVVQKAYDAAGNLVHFDPKP